ncbi:MAG: FAD binding domain-containing protein [candidate division NC10 bacterium]|nr:FAD binding domain-containing protein [candidate division NC10 bacterium]
MKDVEYFTPETLDEAAALLLGLDSRTPPVAEGTDLIAEVTEGQRRLSMVLDLSRIPELNRLDYDERIGLRVGAAVPVPAILEFPPVRRLYPMLADGSASTPPGATLGGNLSPEAPCREMAPPLICLRASAAIFGPHGWSELGVEAVFAGMSRTVLQPGEFVVDLRFPAPPPRSSGAYLRAVDHRNVEAAVAGVGAFLAMEQDLVTCCGARLVLSGVFPTPMRALEAERFLAGKRLEGPVLSEAGALAADRAGPITGAARDRLELVRDLTCRALEEALVRVRANATT